MQSGFTVLSAAYNYNNYFWASITFQPFHQIEIVVFWFYYVLDFQLELKILRNTFNILAYIVQRGHSFYGHVLLNLQQALEF